MRRWWMAVVMSVAVPSVSATELFDAPTHLRFSAQEVSRAARDQQAPAPAAASPCGQQCLRIERIWARLLPAAFQQPGQRAASLHLIVIAAGDSAYASADGGVFLPLELVDTLALTDEEIAFVLAHEMIHVLLEHEREFLTVVDTMLRPDVQRTAADIYGAMQFDLGLLLKTAFIMQASELEADRLGLQLAALAGFDPDRQARALDKLLRSSRGSEAAVLATHPSDADRLAQIHRVLPVARAIYQKGSAG